MEKWLISAKECPGMSFIYMHRFLTKHNLEYLLEALVNTYKTGKFYASRGSLLSRDEADCMLNFINFLNDEMTSWQQKEWMYNLKVQMRYIQKFGENFKNNFLKMHVDHVVNLYNSNYSTNVELYDSRDYREFIKIKYQQLQTINLNQSYSIEKMNSDPWLWLCDLDKVQIGGRTRTDGAESYEKYFIESDRYRIALVIALSQRNILNGDPAGYLKDDVSASDVDELVHITSIDAIENPEYVASLFDAIHKHNKHIKSSSAYHKILGNVRRIISTQGEWIERVNNFLGACDEKQKNHFIKKLSENALNNNHFGYTISNEFLGWTEFGDIFKDEEINVQLLVKYHYFSELSMLMTATKRVR